MSALKVPARKQTNSDVIFAPLASTAHLRIPPPSSHRPLLTSSMCPQLARPTVTLAQRVRLVLAALVLIVRARNTVHSGLVLV